MSRDPNNELRKRYEQALGAELGSLFSELWQELVWLRTVWAEYRVIFGTSPAQIDLANAAAGTFFYIVQKTLNESVLLRLASLTDPPISLKNSAKANLTITALIPLVSADIQNGLSIPIAEALKACEFARDWRNRYIAHRDLALALGNKTTKPLHVASRALVENALNCLGEVLNTVDKHYTGTTTSFISVEPNGGAERLMEVLKKGLAVEEAEELERRKKWGLE